MKWTYDACNVVSKWAREKVAQNRFCDACPNPSEWNDLVYSIGATLYRFDHETNKVGKSYMGAFDGYHCFERSFNDAMDARGKLCEELEKETISDNEFIAVCVYAWSQGIYGNANKPLGFVSVDIVCA